ncbi:LamG-like jellyroll fold domain-containing protein [Sphaerisporangium viridialbum]|uniref:LamG-like jellyroll fold domain-containing protein n=1 Tax=Sphaerisporangium viridialbum TaxID=46189 RepID=UPI003C73A287
MTPIEAPSALAAGAWTHLAVTGTGGLRALYVNGAEVARNAAMTLRPADLGSTTRTGSADRSTAATPTSTARWTRCGSTAAC